MAQHGRGLQWRAPTHEAKPNGTSFVMWNSDYTWKVDTSDALP